MEWFDSIRISVGVSVLSRSTTNTKLPHIKSYLRPKEKGIIDSQFDITKNCIRKDVIEAFKGKTKKPCGDIIKGQSISERRLCSTVLTQKEETQASFKMSMPGKIFHESTITISSLLW